MPLAQFRREIAIFARTATVPFAGIQKSLSFEKEQFTYEEFWREYDLPLAKQSSLE